MIFCWPSNKWWGYVALGMEGKKKTNKNRRKTTHSCQSRTCESPCPPPGSPEPRVRKRWDQDHKSSCERRGRVWETNKEHLKSGWVVETKKKNLADSRVSFKISIVDGLNQLLCYLDDFLFTGYREDKTQKAGEWLRALTKVRVDRVVGLAWWHFLSSPQLLPSLGLSPSAAAAPRSSLTSSTGPQQLPHCNLTQSVTVLLTLNNKKLTKCSPLSCEHIQTAL